MIAVATTYFHIFASRFSLTLIDHPAVLCQSILFLASKSEEEHRRLRDIITVVHRMKYPEAELLHLGAEHSQLREHIVTTEQLLLRILGFNLNVDLPYDYMYNMLKYLNASDALARLATACLNDLYAFSIVLEFPPPCLAAASIFMAIQLSRSTLNDDTAQMQQEELQKYECHIGGGDSKIDPNSRTLALDCIAALDMDTITILEIATRMMNNYELSPVTPFTFEARKST